LKVALLAPGKRHTLNNGQLRDALPGRSQRKRAIASADELLDVLRGTFGLRLPVHQRLRETLDGLVSANL